MKQHLRRVARVLFTVAILVLLAVLSRNHVKWDATWDAIRSASPWMFLAAALVNLLSLALKGVRWWVFLRPVGVTSLSLALKATFAGAGLNNILVANGGEAARVIFVSRATKVPSAKILATFALERLFELIGYVLLLVLGIWLLPLPEHLQQLRPFAIAALILLSIFMVVLIRKDAGEEHAAVENEWYRRLHAYGKHFMHTLQGVSTGPRFGAALLLTLGSWSLQIATYHMTARAAHFPITFTGTVAAILAVNVSFAIRATPGGVGLFQAIYALTAAALGFDTDAAIAVAFLIQIQQIVPVTAIGVALAPEFIFHRKPQTPLPASPPASS